MKLNKNVYTCCLIAVLGFTKAHAQINILTPKEKKQGWSLLFDGKSADQWKGAFLTDFPKKGWHIAEGLLVVENSNGKESTNGGDIITKQLYSDFELSVDFRITEGANSGIKYFVDPAQPVPKDPRSAIGLEYQILDDLHHPDAKLGQDGNRKLASLYDLIPAPQTKPFRGIGEWNTARIISKGNHVEHWLNNIKILEYERGGEDFKARVAISKYKDIPGFGLCKQGALLLQDHGDEVSFRNIKVRRLN